MENPLRRIVMENPFRRIEMENPFRRIVMENPFNILKFLDCLVIKHDDCNHVVLFCRVGPFVHL
jgi:hypothetical protein